MDSDDEIMFHQMTEEMTALEMGDQENDEVIRILVVLVQEEEAEPKRGGSMPGKKANMNGTGRQDICFCSMIILHQLVKR